MLTVSDSRIREYMFATRTTMKTHNMHYMNSRICSLTFGLIGQIFLNRSMLSQLKLPNLVFFLPMLHYEGAGSGLTDKNQEPITTQTVPSHNMFVQSAFKVTLGARQRATRDFQLSLFTIDAIGAMDA